MPKKHIFLCLWLILILEIFSASILLSQPKPEWKFKYQNTFGNLHDFHRYSHFKGNHPQVKFPKIDVHVAAGFASGVRFGLRAQVIENLSVETSFGWSLGSFLGGATLRNYYGVGINLHYAKNSFFIVSLLGAYVRLPDNPFVHSYIISPNIGIMSPANARFRFFLRGGAFFEFKQDYSGHFNEVHPNIDIGVGWSFL